MFAVGCAVVVFAPLVGDLTALDGADLGWPTICGDAVRRAWGQVAVEAGSGDAGLRDDLRDGVAAVPQVAGVVEIVRIHHRGPTDPQAVRARGGHQPLLLAMDHRR